MRASIGKRGRIQAYGGLARQARPLIVQFTLAAFTGGCAAGLHSPETLLRIKPRLEPGYYSRLFDGRLRREPYAVRPIPPLSSPVDDRRACPGVWV